MYSRESGVGAFVQATHFFTTRLGIKSETKLTGIRLSFEIQERTLHEELESCLQMRACLIGERLSEAK